MNAVFIDHPEFGRAIEVLTQALDGLHTIYQRTLLSWKHSDEKEDNYIKNRRYHLRKWCMISNNCIKM
jgi:hypothetical protein